MKLGLARGRREPVWIVMSALARSVGLSPLAWLDLPLRDFMRIVRTRRAS